MSNTFSSVGVDVDINELTKVSRTFESDVLDVCGESLRLLSLYRDSRCRNTVVRTGRDDVIGGVVEHERAHLHRFAESLAGIHQELADIHGGLVHGIERLVAVDVEAAEELLAVLSVPSYEE